MRISSWPTPSGRLTEGLSDVDNGGLRRICYPRPRGPPSDPLMPSPRPRQGVLHVRAAAVGAPTSTDPSSQGKGPMARGMLIPDIAAGGSEMKPRVTANGGVPAHAVTRALPLHTPTVSVPLV